MVGSTPTLVEREDIIYVDSRKRDVVYTTCIQVLGQILFLLPTTRGWPRTTDVNSIHVRTHFYFPSSIIMVQKVCTVKEGLGTRLIHVWLFGKKFFGGPECVHNKLST